jgi:hypothetical protein
MNHLLPASNIDFRIQNASTTNGDWSIQRSRVAFAGLEITADQRSMIGRKLFLIGEEATLPFILIGKKYI